MRHALIVVAGRRGDEVFAVGLVHALGQHRGVEDDGQELVAEVVDGLSVGQGQTARIDRVQRLAQELLAELGPELLAAIVMVYAAGEPQALQVGGEGAEVVGVVVYAAVGVDGLQRTAYGEVVTSELVEGDVAAVERGLRQIINEPLLL